MQLRKPVYVVGEGLTEKHYFRHIKNLQGFEIQVKPRLFSPKNALYYLINRTRELLEQDIIVICVFDADISKRNKKEKQLLSDFNIKYKNNKNLHICDSLPSIEFWFLLHHITTHRSFNNYKELRDELRKYIRRYDKKEAFLQSESWVKPLIKRQDKAINRAKQIAGRGGSYTNIYKAIEFLIKNRKA